MDWQALLTTLGGAGILIAAAAWLTKQLVTAFLSKDLEKFKSELKAKNDLAIEEFRSRLQSEVQKTVIAYSSLHTKRAELIADLYRRLAGLQSGIRHVLMELGRREYREEAWREFDEPREPWEMKAGIDTLDSREKERVDELTRLSREFFDFYGVNKIYFSDEVCKLLDRFATLSIYLAMSYQSIALKDTDGRLRVDPKVKEGWDSSIEVIFQLLSALEREFRALLGVQ